MACFIAPTAAAIILKATKKKIAARYHVEWLLALLWGGAAWLIPEHIYHGEVVLYPPFFTAGIHQIIPEVLRVGISMTIAAVALWMVLLAVAALLKDRKFQPHIVSLMVVGAVVMVLVDTLLA